MRYEQTPSAKRIQILSMLCEGRHAGNQRVVGVSLNTVTKLLIDAGKACWAYHDEHVRGVKATRMNAMRFGILLLETEERGRPPKPAGGAGDVWTWTALEASSKLMVSFMVGGRDSEYAMALMDDLRGRLANRVQLRRMGTGHTSMRSRKPSGTISTTRSS